MATPPLHKVLEPDKVSALLANFAQMFPGSLRVYLVDVECQIVGQHPFKAPAIASQQLSFVVDHMRHQGKLTSLPIGLVAPVRARGELVGVLIVALPHTFKGKDTAALQLMARVLSLMAENNLAREDLLQETLGRYREINLLYHVGETIAASLDLTEVNRLILYESIRLIQADEGTVMLRDRESGQLTVWASRGLDAVEDIGAGIPLGHEPAAQVLRSGKTEIFENPPLGRRKKPIKELLCVPLKIKDEVLGVISLAHAGSDRTFLANDITLLNALAGQAAVAIDNAQMFSDLSTLHAELEAVNRRLRELDKLKSSFLGVITHELRSPFANIDFSRQLIERYGTMEWPEAQQEQWTQLTSSIREAKGMIDNLVSFAGLLSRQGELTLTDVDISALIREVIETLAHMARAREIELLVRAPESMPPVTADRSRLGEAVYHLIQNAIKFSHVGGKVMVYCWTKDDKVRFTVQDTGIGIPEDKLELLGDPFSQMADPLRRGVEGLGLGLALVKYVVNAHGGQLEMKSQENVGSTFGFWLPITRPGQATP